MTETMNHEVNQNSNNFCESKAREGISAVSQFAVCDLCRPTQNSCVTEKLATVIG